jgi:hypothetical protein
MSARSWSYAALFAYALFGAIACSFDDDANAANGCDASCAVCHLGFCLSMRDDGISGGGMGATGGAAGAGGMNGGVGGVSVSGAGGAGTGGAGGGGAGGVGGGGVGGGGAGGVGGDPQGCAQGMSAGPETCNGVDDDCDDEVDEDTTVACYPDGESGCTANTDGTFTCSGLCTSGTQTCASGVLGACTGAVTPSTEACGGAEAADEDCDGTIDDGCACEGSETQRCYSGPRFTAGIGECVAGTQTCQEGAFGDCVGEVTPVAEACGNPDEDNNCNGRVDDVPNENTFCFDFSQEGECAFGIWWCAGDTLVCRTNEPEDTETSCDGLDEDCDGNIDETFDFSSDEDNCGQCGMGCGDGDLCCSGVCKDIDSDPAHCGGCNETCNLTCCDGDCVSTNTIDYCLACNVQCDPGQGCCETGCESLNTTDNCRECGETCETGYGCCAEGCAPLDTNLHCGNCETTCLDTQTCIEGDCVTVVELPCEAGGTYCPPGACMFCVANQCQDAMGNVCI